MSKKIKASVTADRAEYIRQKIQDGLCYIIDDSVGEIVECMDELTPSEKRWADKHIDWKAVII